MKRTLLALMLLAAAAFAQSGGPAAPPSAPANTASAAVTKDVVDSFMRHIFGYQPGLKWDVVRIQPSAASGLTEAVVDLQMPQGTQRATLFITPDAKYAITGDVMPFGADPFAPVRNLLASKATGPSRGAANAQLQIVEFGDLQCPHCKNAVSIVDKLMADNPNAKLVWENFPLTSHDWAFKAAEWADCIGRANNAAFWKFAANVYTEQDNITVQNADDKFAAAAAGAGADTASTQRCIADPATKARVDASLQLGRDAGVTGTPTLFLNGRRIGDVEGTPYEVLNAIAKFEAQFTPTGK